MARIRTIKPELSQSESLARVSRDARLCFILLWTIVDDDGRARASSRMLASLLFPYDDDAPSLIENWIEELEREGCIRRYMVDGSHYLDIPKWLIHQKIDRPSASRFPPFAEGSSVPREKSRADDEASSNPRASRAQAGPGPGPGPGPETRAGRASVPEGWELWWEAYPHKVGKDAALPAYRKALAKAAASTLLAGLKAYIASKPADRPWCNPATWLNQGRWADRPAAAQAVLPINGAPTPRAWEGYAPTARAAPGGVTGGSREDIEMQVHMGVMTQAEGAEALAKLARKAAP